VLFSGGSPETLVTLPQFQALIDFTDARDLLRRDDRIVRLTTKTAHMLRRRKFCRRASTISARSASVTSRSNPGPHAARLSGGEKWQGA